MNKENTFTSTGIKLLHHPEVIQELQCNMALPISMEVAPTSRCQLSCVFCSNVNRSSHEDLDPRKLEHFIREMKNLDLKTVAWSGGGDPTMYSHINEMISWSYHLGLEQGMITNGLGFKKLETLEYLKWIRISMNCLDYVKDIEIPDMPLSTTLGFSYVINDRTKENTFDRIKSYVDRYNPSYVRIVPNCQVSHEQQIINNKIYSELVDKLGEPFFYQSKEFEKPELCYWGYLKPFLLHDGYVYRCSSVVLNDDAERSFHEKYRWCRMEDLPEQYDKKIIPFIPDSCDKCVFTKQNDLINEIIHPMEMKNFV